jgi:uncharacterized protein YdeI (YjbR/CyaY-like superfamily)
VAEETLYVRNREEWRAWLEENHDRKDGIWLIYPKKHTGKPRIPYGDAVEEALSFGWIDSTARRIDDDTFAQRFSRRRKGSAFSQPNIERMRRLIREGRMTPAGLAAMGDPGVLSGDQPLVMAPDIEKALREDPQVWENFENFPGIYKRIRIAYIEDGRRHGEGEFRKRLANFLKKTKANRRFGFGEVQSE